MLTKLMLSWLLVMLLGIVVVNSWSNNIGEPKRDTGSLAGDPKASLAAALLADVAAPSMLKQRAISLDSQAYQPGIKLKDVYYPAWFAGRWEASSVFDVVDAPLGDEVFGGKPVLTAAQKDLESKLSYPVLFKTLSPDQILSVANIGISGTVISDRLYNVEQIALASMGPDSIIDDAQKDSDLARKLSLAVSPTASNEWSTDQRLIIYTLIMTPQGTVFDIDLIVTDREQSQVTPNTFEALERTAQVITVRARLAVPPAPLRKEIETITCYTLVDPTTIVATQRTATFLSPLDPRYRLAAGRDARVSNTAVDIRRYTVTYKKIA